MKWFTYLRTLIFDVNTDNGMVLLATKTTHGHNLIVYPNGCSLIHFMFMWWSVDKYKSFPVISDSAKWRYSDKLKAAVAVELIRAVNLSGTATLSYIIKEVSRGGA